MITDTKPQTLFLRTSGICRQDTNPRSDRVFPRSRDPSLQWGRRAVSRVKAVFSRGRLRGQRRGSGSSRVKHRRRTFRETERRRDESGTQGNRERNRKTHPGPFLEVRPSDSVSGSTRRGPTGLLWGPRGFVLLKRRTTVSGEEV